MNRDLAEELRGLRRRLGEAEGYLDVEGSRRRLAELETQIAKPDLWDDAEQAQRLTREYARVKTDVDDLAGLEKRLSDAETLHELAEEEDDDGVDDEATAAAGTVASVLNELELRSLFAGEHDEFDAVCEIHAKDGGTDAQDWAEMLLRMYQRWAERRGFDVEVDDVSQGSEAGILSATFIVHGRFATGLLASERGVHRLVRISPFDSQA
ncbi:MAG: PCRF domain-containing protein, partial [Acidimicrobiales bacterium]